MKLEFEKNNYKHIDKLKKLWCSSFDEKRKAVDLFFEKCKDFTSIYSAIINENVVSMLYLVHAELNGKQAHYLCGAATERSYRNQGIMGSLIEYALKDSQSNGDVYSLLFPANADLYSYYERFGYKSLCTAEKTVLSKSLLLKFSETFNLETDSNNEINYEELQRQTYKNNFLLQNNKFMDFASEYYKLYGCKTVKSKDCFAIFDDKNGIADVFYSLFTDFSQLAGLLLNSTNAEQFIFTGKLDEKNAQNSNTEKYGMIKSLNDKQDTPDNIFIGITLD